MSQPENSTTDPYIVLVESETDLAESIQTSLEDHGYSVRSISNGQQALRQVSRYQPSLMIIDEELPDMSGYEVCRTAHSMTYHIPIILLSTMGKANSGKIAKTGNSSSSSNQPDKILKKPVEGSQLLDAVLEQLHIDSSGETGTDTNHIVTLGTVQVNLGNAMVHQPNGTAELTERETDLLRYLYENANKPVYRKKLLENVWKYQNTTNTRTVDVHIAKLRAKIEQDPSNPDYLITLHGIGYMLDLE